MSAGVFRGIGPVALFLLAFAPGGGARQAAPGNTQARLRAPVQSYSISRESFVVALAGIGGKFHLPMGIVWVDTPSARRPLTLSWRRTTVGKIVDAIAGSQPGYAVRTDGNVVRVFPAASVPQRENFLALRIPAYNAHNEFVDAASRQLWVMANRLVAPPAPPRHAGLPSGVAGSGASTIEYPQVTIALRNARIADILDALVLSSPKKIWIVTFEGRRALTPTGFRRTRTLWTRQPVPDGQQPTWNLLHWGDPVPRALLTAR